MDQTAATSTDDGSSTQPASTVEPESSAPFLPFSEDPQMQARQTRGTILIALPGLTMVIRQPLTEHISLELEELTAGELARKAARETAGGDAARARRGWAPSFAQAEEERATYFPFENGLLSLLASMDDPRLLSYASSSQATAEDRAVFYAHCAEGFIARSRHRTLDLAAMGVEWPQDDTDWFVFADAQAATAKTLAELANNDDPEFITMVQSSGGRSQTKVSILEKYIVGAMARTQYRSNVALSLAQAFLPHPPSEDLFGTSQPLGHPISKMSRLFPLCAVPDDAPAGRTDTGDEGARASGD